MLDWQSGQSALHVLQMQVGQESDSQESRSFLHGKHLINACTKQQSVEAPNTAEAELCAGNCAAVDSMRVQSFAKDLDRISPLRLHIDSSAVPSSKSRTGLRKAKRIEIQHLWLQEAVRNGTWAVGGDPLRDEFTRLRHEATHEQRTEMFVRLVNCFHVCTWEKFVACRPSSCAMQEVCIWDRVELFCGSVRVLAMWSS